MKEMEIKIRRAEFLDLDEIHKVEVESFTEPWSRSLIKVALTDSLTEVWVVEIDKVVGFMICSKLFEASLDNIAILKNYRGNGLGVKLLEKLIEFAEEKEITLEVEHDNEVAKRIYHKFGFRIEGMRENYYGKGRHAYIMWRRR
ncbi:MAG: ribosomal protein S18-alanine N-acetyltransferase [Peptoniphilus sp.]|nr:ribosomal protein S18-alanine N-acetyltransferase [Peptoniphilus sp.]